MRPLSLAARPLLGSVFVLSGADGLRDPGPRAEEAGPALHRLRDAVPGIPDDPTVAVRANSAVRLVAGSMLVLGKAPRLAACVLAATVLPYACATAVRWREGDQEERSRRRARLAEDAGLLGGLLAVAGDNRGRPGLGWRVRHAGRSRPARTVPGRRPKARCLQAR